MAENATSTGREDGQVQFEGQFMPPAPMEESREGSCLSSPPSVGNPDSLSLHG